MSENKEVFVTGMNVADKAEKTAEYSTTTATNSEPITVKMSDNQIEEVVKAATEATPEEVLKMNHSIEDTSEIENEEFAPTVREWSIEHLGYVIEPQYLYDSMIAEIEDKKFTIEKFEKAISSLIASTLGQESEPAFEKLFDDMPVAERIEKFMESHDLHKRYPNLDFFSWHHRLTGSCLQGRTAFAQDHGIVLDGSMTTKEFLELTKDSYGGDIIRRTIKAYEA